MSKIKYTFVHIPKNAGTSIQSLIKEKQLPAFEYAGHHFRKNKIKSSTIKICIYRDPMERFISAFYYSKKEHPKSPSHKIFDNPNQLINAFRTPTHPKHKGARAFMGNKKKHNMMRFLEPTKFHVVGGIKTAQTWVFEPQTSWLRKLPSPEKNIYLKFDNLTREFNILMKHLYPKKEIKLPYKNVTSKKLKNDFSVENLTVANKGFLRKFYENDYKTIKSINEHYTLDKQLLRVLPLDGI
jgi:hypothetical protein